MISSITEQTGSAVAGMRAGGDQVKSGVAMVSQAKDTLDGINNKMKKTIDMASEITHATVEQQNAMADLSGNINRVTEMTEQNLSVADHAEQLARELNNSVERMMKAVAQYTIY